MLAFLVVTLLVSFSILVPPVESQVAGFRWPLANSNGRGQQHQEFNPTRNSGRGAFHLGEDWNRPYNPPEDCNIDFGDNVYSIADGEVIYKDDDRTDPHPLGKILVVKHTLANGAQVNSAYYHLEQIFAGNPPARVSRDRAIGTVGNSNGEYDCAHLHYEIQVDTKVDSGGIKYIPTLDPWVFYKYTDPTKFIQQGVLSKLFVLSACWNMVAHPFVNAIGSDAALVQRDKTLLIGGADVREDKKTMTQAANAGWIDPIITEFELVNGQWAWTMFDIGTMTIPLKTSGEYWMYAKEDDVRITLFGTMNPLHQQAQIDMIRHAEQDRRRFLSIIPSRFDNFSDFDRDYEHRWMEFNFSGNRIVYITHATSKSDSSIRWVAFYDPDARSWTAWTRVQ